MSKKIVTLLLIIGMMAAMTACKADIQKNSDTVKGQVTDTEKEQLTEQIKEQLPTPDELDSLISETLWWYQMRLNFCYYDENVKKVKSLTPEEAAFMAVMSVCEDSLYEELEHTEDYYNILPQNIVKEKERELFGRVYDNVDWSLLENVRIKQNENGDILFPQGDWGSEYPKYEIYDIFDESAEDETLQVIVNYYTMQEEWGDEKELPSQDFVVKYDISKGTDGKYHIENVKTQNVEVKYYTSISEIPLEWFDKMQEHIQCLTKKMDKESIERTYNLIHYGKTEYVGSRLLQSNEDKHTQLIALYKCTCGLDYTDEKGGWEDSFVFYISYLYEDMGINAYKKSVGNLYPEKWSDKTFEYCCENSYTGDFGWYGFEGYADYETWIMDVEQYLKNNNMTIIDTDMTN